MKRLVVVVILLLPVTPRQANAKNIRMCGRFNLTSNPKAVADLFGLLEVPELPPRYNIAPSQPIATVGLKPDGKNHGLTFIRWGLVPNWATGQQPSAFINAKSETAATKPAFRAAFKSHRCLIPASGFYEWKTASGGKQPYHFRRRDGRPFAFAGLWSPWHGPQIDRLTCCLLTTEANDTVRPVHDRMPVILSPDEFTAWLDPGTSTADLSGLAATGTGGRIGSHSGFEVGQQPEERGTGVARSDAVIDPARLWSQRL